MTQSSTPDRPTPDLSEWIEALAAVLRVDPALVDVPALLAVAGDVAHHVARPAAPISTFLVALAAMNGGEADVEAVRRAAAQVSSLARAWPADQSESQLLEQWLEPHDD